LDVAILCPRNLGRDIRRNNPFLNAREKAFFAVIEQVANRVYVPLAAVLTAISLIE
jgi:hypothetical protein